MNGRSPRPRTFRPGRPAAIVPLTVAVCLAMVCAGALGAGCSKDSGSSPSASAQPVVLDPVAAPAGLIAELFVPKPDATWSKLRSTLGGPAVFLPASLGALATSVLGLPASLMTEFDGAIPVLGAVVEEEGTLRGVIGIHVKSGDRLIVALTKGEGARFTSRRDAATSITLLEPVSQTRQPGDAGAPGEESPVALGVLSNYLLVGRTSVDLTVAGPYVARTLPAAPVPKDEVTIQIPASALSGPILAKARAAGERVRAMGAVGLSAGGAAGAGVLPSEMPFSQMIQSAVEVVGDLRQARLSVNVDEQGVHMRFAGTPKSVDGAAAKWISGMSPGDPQRLLELPSDTAVALWRHDKAESRKNGADSYANALVMLLSPSFPASDRDTISAALSALAEARGDWMAIGLAFSPTGPSAYMRGAVADEAKLVKSLREFLALSKLPAVQAKIKEKGLKVSMGKKVVEGIAGDVQRFRIERLEAKPAATVVPSLASPSLLPTSIDLLYTIHKDTLVVATGYEAQEALLRAHAAPGGENLGANPAMKAAVGALGTDVSFVVTVDPLRWLSTQSGKPDGGVPAPVVFAAGREAAAGDSPGSLWWRLDVARAAIQEAVKRRGAL